MAEPLALIAVVIASVGTAAAFYAVMLYRADRRTIRQLAEEAHAFIGALRGHLHDPAYLGQVLGHTLTHGIKREDGGPVTTALVLNMLIDDKWEEIKPMLPQLIQAYVAGKGSAPVREVQGRNADGTWAKGGWSAAAAAKAVGKATGSSMLAKVAEVAQVAQQIAPVIKDLKESGLIRSGGDGGTPHYSQQGKSAWRPPF